MNAEYERAKKLIREDKIGEGCELLEKLAQEEPNPEILNDAGVCLYLLGEFSSAIERFKRALAAKADFALPKINLFYLEKACDLTKSFDLQFRSINHDNFSQAAPPPKISVIVRTYNRPQLLKNALACLKNQTFRNFETIVVNDGGPEEIEKVCRESGLNGLRYHRFAHGGPAAGLNRGLEMARGEFIAFYDDDDVIYPNHLQGLLGCLEKAGQPGVAYSDVRVNYFDRSENLVRSKIRSEPEVNLEVLFRYDPISSMLVLVSREIFEKLGRFYEPLAVTGNDWEMWIRIARHYKFFHLPEITAEFQERDRPDRGSRLGLFERYYYSNLVLYIHRALALFSFPQIAANESAYRTAVAELNRLLQKYPGLEKKLRLYGLYHARTVHGFFYERARNFSGFGAGSEARDFYKLALKLKPLEPKIIAGFARSLFGREKGRA